VLVDQVRAGGAREASADVARWAWSEGEAVGFRSDLTRPVEPPPSRIEITIAPLDKALAPAVFDTTGLDPADLLYLERRRAIWDAGFDGGWVALDPSGTPAYLQWFIPSHQSDLVQSFWGGLFPRIEPGTLLAEGAWVPPPFRGQKIMAEAMARFGQATRAAGAAQGDEVTHATTWVSTGNRGALFGCVDAGYAVDRRRTETWRLGRRTLTFAPATAADFPVFAERR
jgi:hypothetical protein